MRILIDQSGYALLNMGDWAMLQVAVARCYEIFPSAEISVLGADSRRIANCIPNVLPVRIAGRSMAIGDGCLFGRWSNLLGNLDRRLSRSFPNVTKPLIRLRYRNRGWPMDALEEFYSAVHTADLVIASGGGYITDEFPEMVEGVCGLLATAQSLGKPTAMFGQGLGPLKTAALRSKASAAMRRLRLMALREGIRGPGLASDLGTPPDRVFVTGDDAIELAYASRSPGPGKLLGLNIRVAPYSGLDDIQIESLHGAIRQILSAINTETAVIPISLHGNDEDIRSTQRLLPDHKNGSNDKVQNPLDVIRLIGSCRVVITGSYHAGVFALAQGIPVIALAKSQYYADKFGGLAAQFGEGCAVLNMSDEEFSDKLLSTTLDFWERASQLRPALIRRAESQIDASRRTYQKMRAWFN